MRMDFDSSQVHSSLLLLKQLETWMLAYKLVFEFVAKSGRFSEFELYSKLQESQATVQLEMNDKYDAALQTLKETSDQAEALKALKFLAEWKSKGPAQ
jgi:hypothetical protein